MIDKINGNDSYGFHSNNSTNKRKNPAVRAYENTPGADASGQKRAERNRKKESTLADQKDSGVILDLSGKPAGKKKAADAAGWKKDFSLTDVLRRLAAPIVQWLKDFWGPDRSAEENIEEELAAGKTMMDATEAPDTGDAEGILEGALPPLDEIFGTDEQKAMADQAVKSGSLQQIEQFVTQNGTKRLAHNSDLLTYYDRRGKFVEMDETEKYRVLFGDKNVLKL